MWAFLAALVRFLLGAFARAPQRPLQAPGAVSAPTPAAKPQAPRSTPPGARTGDVAFEAGYHFFMGPQYDGHEKDDAPTEAFHTRFGVTEMTYAQAYKEGIVAKPFSECHSPDDMKPIYRRDFYDRDRCGEMPAPVAMVCFVDATLMGDKTPAMNLQRILGVEADGQIGPHTLLALRGDDAHAVATKLEAADLAHLRTLGNWGMYANGWTHREQNLLAEALKLA